MFDKSEQSDSESLKQAIHTAFNQTPVPDKTDVGIAVGGGPEVNEIGRRVSGKTWPELLQALLDMDPGDRNYFHSVFQLFTPFAFHYYLPAFMFVSMNPVEADVVGESLFRVLAPSDELGSYPDEWFTEFQVLVTPPQREAIRSLILYVNDQCQQLEIGNVTGNTALRDFWFPEGFPRHIFEDDFL